MEAVLKQILDFAPNVNTPRELKCMKGKPHFYWKVTNATFPGHPGPGRPQMLRAVGSVVVPFLTVTQQKSKNVYFKYSRQYLQK